MDKVLYEKVNGIIDNHTCRRLFPVIPEEPGKDDDDIVTYVRKQKVTKIGDGPDDYIIEEVVVEDSRVNRQAFIAKDAKDVGVLNILEKVRRSGDVTLLNQTGATINTELQDYTNSPHNVQEALNALETGSNSFEGLKAIFGDVSFEKLAGMNSAEIETYLRNYVEKNTKKGEE